ncbi:hypothetical protein [Parvularcula marina]|uniref:hypothetical protein n=1 Tax=Parvularcula marina TaxID=2292771 RepID=UPI0035168B02
MRDAAGQPLGAYIKSILFAPSGKGAASRALIDQNRTLLAQILATLGSSGIGEGLSELARTVDGGTLRDDDLHAVLNKAESELSEIRVLLLKALGLRGNSK